MSAFNCRSGIAVFLVSVFLLCCLSCAHLLKADKETLAAQWKTHLNARDYAGALEVYASAVSSFPDDRELQQLYLDAAETLKDLGAKEYGRGEFGQAERIYTALLGTYPGLQRLSGGPSFTRSDLRQKRTLARIRGTEAAAKLHFSRGDYRKGLDVYKNAYRNLGREPQFLKAYAGAVEEVKQSADRAFERGDLAASGQICGILLADFSSFTYFSKTLSFPRQSLVTRVKECSSSLTRKGLGLYRLGKISEAIAVWEDILAFDDSPDTRKMIGTASEQLKKLQQ